MEYLENLKKTLANLGIKQIEIADFCGIQKTQINEVLKGKRGINIEFAVCIEFMTNQKIKAYDLLKAQLDHGFNIHYPRQVSKLENKTKRKLLDIKIKLEYFNNISGNSKL